MDVGFLGDVTAISAGLEHVLVGKLEREPEGFGIFFGNPAITILRDGLIEEKFWIDVRTSLT